MTPAPGIGGLKRAAFETQELLRLMSQVATGSMTRPFYWRDVVEQFDAVGLGSMPVVLMTGLFTGMVLALQSGLTLDQFGGRSLVGRLVSAAMVRELGPVLTALMVTGRVASGIAAELGSMVVTEQISALRALGTDPVRKLVIPRVLAGTVMVPVLTIIGDSVGVVGGAIISRVQLRIAGSVYWNNVVQGLGVQDLWMGLIKPIVFGFTLVIVACHVGLRTTGGTQGVGRSTTNAVVGGSVAILALDFVITRLLISTIY